jgi:hypothetical protein
VGSKLRSSQARQGAKSKINLAPRKKKFTRDLPKERADGSTGSRDDVDGRKRRHFEAKIRDEAIMGIRRN